MKKGDLVINKRTKKTGTIVCEPFTKLFRDADDWAAAAHGYDSATAATAVRVCWHDGGYERTYKSSDLRRNNEIVSNPESTDKTSAK